MIKGIILDFDEVIVDTIKACASVYYNDFKKEANLDNLYRWDMLDIFPEYDIKDIGKLFENDIFWENLTIKKGAKEFIKKYQDEGLEIIICSKGSMLNLVKKAKFIKDNLDGIETILMSITNKDTDKSLINMKKYIFVDDHQDNLLNSNAYCKILFAEYDLNKEWNEKHNGRYCKNFKQLDGHVESILLAEEVIDKEYRRLR